MGERFNIDKLVEKDFHQAISCKGWKLKKEKLDKHNAANFFFAHEWASITNIIHSFRLFAQCSETLDNELRQNAFLMRA